MRRIFFPAIFKKSEEGGFEVSFYDLPIFTFGNDIQHSLLMAEDALKVTIDYYIKERKRIPVPSRIQEIELKNPDSSFIQFVGVDILDA